MSSRNDVEQLLGRLVGPTGRELGCDECFEMLDHYVELELADADPEAAIPGMGAHLEGCAACAEDRDSVRTFLLSAR
jgi:hypothetical protein